MIGTTRSRVSFFMNRFRKLGLISYNGRIQVHKSLLNVILLDQLPEQNAQKPAVFFHLTRLSTKPRNLNKAELPMHLANRLELLSLWHFLKRPPLSATKPSVNCGQQCRNS